MPTTELTPDYLVIGHVSKDVPPRGGTPTLGGTASYSSLTAQRLGMQAAIVTSYADKDEALLQPLREAGIWVTHVPSRTTTTFVNSYDVNGSRMQRLDAQATIIEHSAVPEAWRSAKIIHLGPIAREVDAGIISGGDTSSLLCATPQGWMRKWTSSGEVSKVPEPVPAVLLGSREPDLLVLSIEDLDGNEGLVHSYCDKGFVVAITHGGGDLMLFVDGALQLVPAQSARPTDPTGAGDVFAAAFFIRYSETKDPRHAALFAHAAAACVIEGPGTSSIPTRETVVARMNSRRT